MGTKYYHNFNRTQSKRGKSTEVNHQTLKLHNKVKTYSRTHTQSKNERRAPIRSSLKKVHFQTIISTFRFFFFSRSRRMRCLRQFPMNLRSRNLITDVCKIQFSKFQAVCTFVCEILHSCNLFYVCTQIHLYISLIIVLFDS